MLPGEDLLSNNVKEVRGMEEHSFQGPQTHGAAGACGYHEEVKLTAYNIPELGKFWCI